ncbi:Uncharacterised protein [Klebsiella pneumoniae]|nr:Uncharacterised protein [Klebsiella pneumoniae]
MLTKYRCLSLREESASLTLKPGKSDSTLIAMLQSEQIEIITIDDTQAEVLLLAIRQAFLHADAEDFLNLIDSTTDFVMLYAVQVMEDTRFNYEYLNTNYGSRIYFLTISRYFIVMKPKMVKKFSPEP